MVAGCVVVDGSREDCVVRHRVWVSRDTTSGVWVELVEVLGRGLRVSVWAYEVEHPDPIARLCFLPPVLVNQPGPDSVVYGCVAEDDVDGDARIQSSDDCARSLWECVE